MIWPRLGKTIHGHEESHEERVPSKYARNHRGFAVASLARQWWKRVEPKIAALEQEEKKHKILRHFLDIEGILAAPSDEASLDPAVTCEEETDQTAPSDEASQDPAVTCEEETDQTPSDEVSLDPAMTCEEETHQTDYPKKRQEKTFQTSSTHHG